MTARFDVAKARNSMGLRARAARDVGKRAVERASEEAAETARSTSAWNDKSGKTRASIKARPGPGLYSASVVAKRAAVFLENGTGKYGPKGAPYPIVARGGVLSFMVNGKRVFARKVMHPGIKATHFMRDAAEQERPRFLELCVISMNTAIGR